VRAYTLHDSAQLCAHLMRDRAVYAPVIEAEEAHWRKVEQPVSLHASTPRPLFSPKQLFFAEREALFRFDGKRFVSTLPDAQPQALFGARACDLVAIGYQDQFFATDAHYQRRRAATLLVGIDCAAPCSPHAFCHAMDAGPSVRPSTADLIVCFDAERDDCTLVAETAAGEEALRGLSLAPAPASWESRRAAVDAHTRERLTDAAPLTQGIERLDQGRVSAERWEQLGLQCVACSGCTTACPTCSCFAVRDERDAEGPGTTRSRFWDSCLLEGFQREASGHHPAASAGQRVERFYYHKLSSDFATTFGRRGCVGCGRCDLVCPGSIGAQSVLRRLAVP